MGSCRCTPPAVLHIQPSGVHLPGGELPDLVLVDEVWSDRTPHCSVCEAVIDSTFFRCVPCDAVVCRACVTLDTLILECDCEPEMHVTGVQLAAMRASAQLSR